METIIGAHRMGSKFQLYNAQPDHVTHGGEDRIEIYIVHPEPGELERIKVVLQGEPDLAVKQCATSSAEALQALASTSCDVMLISCRLADNEALALVQAVVAANEAPRVLVTDMPHDTETALHWMEEGAAGYVYAHEGWADLVKKIRAAHTDEFMLCPDIAAALIARIAELKQLAHELDAGALAQPSVIYAELTPREREVLHLIGQEMSNQEIADALVIELGTVKNHVHNLLRKLDVCNRRQAAQVARQIMAEPLSDLSSGS
ncbi:MAG: hypothetical protein DCC55_16915 [Chloroflexi bacterium]|nr:MAG: hypothetical protein DCC55_16915 [Chloroflexota bacterium]